MATSATIQLKWLVDRHEYKEKYELDEPLTIGRHSDNKLVIDVPTVSRFHAQVTVVGNKVLIKNVSTANGMAIVKDTGLLQMDHASSPVTLERGFKIILSNVTINVIDIDLGDNTNNRQMIECPNCGRALSSSLEECPYDGFSLAAAKTVFVDANNLNIDNQKDT